MTTTDPPLRRYTLETPYGVVACTAQELLNLKRHHTTFGRRRVLRCLNLLEPAGATRIGRMLGVTQGGAYGHLSTAWGRGEVEPVENGKYRLTMLGRAVLEAYQDQDANHHASTTTGRPVPNTSIVGTATTAGSSA